MYSRDSIIILTEWDEWKLDIQNIANKVRLQTQKRIHEINQYSPPFTEQQKKEKSKLCRVHYNYSTLLQLCIKTETDESVLDEDISFIKTVNDLYVFVRQNKELCDFFKVNDLINNSLFDRLKSYEEKLAEATFQPNELIDECKSIMPQKAYPADVGILINKFHTKLHLEGNNYFLCYDIIQNQLNNEITFFDKNKKTKIQFFSYLRHFDQQFRLMLHKKSERTAKSKEKNSKIPLPFLNPEIQIFNFNLSQYLDKQIKKTKSRLIYKLNGLIVLGNEQTDDELNFFEKLNNKLKNVEDFVESPVEYLNIIDGINNYLQYHHVSKISAETLKQLKGRIYNKIFVNNTSSRNGIAEEKKCYGINFYNEISLPCKLFASWEYSKGYLRNLQGRLNAFQEKELYPHLKLKRLFIPTKWDHTDRFIQNLNDEIGLLLKANAGNNDSRKYAFDYVIKLIRKIELLSGSKVHAYKNTLLNMLKNELGNYLKFITLDNQIRFKFDNHDMHFFYVVSLRILPSKPSTRDFVDNYESHFLTEPLHTEVLQKFNSNQDDLLNSFEDKYASKKVEKLIEDRNENLEFKESEIETAIKKEHAKISQNQHLNIFYHDLQKNLYAHFISALVMQRNELTKESSSRAKDAKSIFSFGGLIANLIPGGVGTTLEKVLNITSDQMTAYLNERHQAELTNNANRIKHAQMDDFVAYIARKLTQILENQINLITPSSFNDFINVIIERISRGIADTQVEEPEKLAQVAIMSVLASNQRHGYFGLKNVSLNGIEDAHIFSSTGYTAEGMLSASGIVIYDQQGKPTYYGKHDGNYTLYGFRRGTQFDVELHNLHELDVSELNACNKKVKQKHTLDYTGLKQPVIHKPGDNEMLKLIEKLQEEVADEKEKTKQLQQDVVYLKSALNTLFNQVPELLSHDNKTNSKERYHSRNRFNLSKN